MEAGSPTFVFKGDSGGGEAQMAFRKGAYSYIVYDWNFRTDFGPSGHHDQAFIQGVLVRRDGRTLADLHCTHDPPDAASDLYHTGETAPAGEHVDHSLWRPAEGVQDAQRHRPMRVGNAANCKAATSRTLERRSRLRAVAFEKSDCASAVQTEQLRLCQATP